MLPEFSVATNFLIPDNASLPVTVNALFIEKGVNKGFDHSVKIYTGCLSECITRKDPTQ